MDTLIFLFFSSIEWLALLLLMFAMFKFQLRGYWGQIILTSLAMSLLSHLVFKELDQRILATILQPPFLMLFLWQMFRVHIFYAGLMTIYGYLAYMIIQVSCMYTLDLLGIPLELIPNTLPTYLFQLGSIAATLLVFYVLHRRRIGYTFVPDNINVPLRMKGLNSKILVFMLIGYSILTSFNFIPYPTSLFFVIGASAVIGVLLYFAQRKEYGND